MQPPACAAKSKRSVGKSAQWNARSNGCKPTCASCRSETGNDLDQSTVGRSDLDDGRELRPDRRHRPEDVRHMSDLYDTDILEWSERQGALLRRLAAGE